MPRPLTATIDIAALAHNLQRTKAMAPNAKVWAVVKANAYGHGIACAMQGFAAAEGLALIEPDVAISLRTAGWTKPLLLLEGCFDDDDLRLAQTHHLDITVHCEDQLQRLEKMAPQDTPFHNPLNVHLKMNSGMHRLGFAPHHYAQAYARLAALPHVGKITLMTHFANADDPNKVHVSFDEQRQCFEQASRGLAGERSLANSAEILLHPDVPSDWIRPGIMLYGATPSNTPAANFGLRPAMTLHSEIIAIQSLRPGDCVGYGSLFTAQHPMTVGIVACGYADGYPRSAPNGTPILVEGYRTGTLGRVSMDMLAVDLTPIPHAHIGSLVTLWGDGLPIDDVAQAAGTIGYELMCALAGRVRRR